MASICDELKISSKKEKEEWKSNARIRDKLIARRLKQRENINEYVIAAGLEPLSCNSKVTEYDWLLKPPSLIKQMYSCIPGEDSQAHFKRSKLYTVKASTSSKEADGVKSTLSEEVPASSVVA